MSKRKKIGLWVGGVIVALIILVIAIPSDDKKDTADADTKTAPAKTTAAPAPVKKATKTRFTKKEWDSYLGSWLGVMKEKGQLGEQAPGCAVLMDAMEASEAAKCLDRALDGLDVEAGMLRLEVDRYQGRMTGKCGAALRQMSAAVKDYEDAATRTQVAGKNLNIDVFSESASDLTNQDQRMTARHRAVLAACDYE